MKPRNVSPSATCRRAFFRCSKSIERFTLRPLLEFAHGARVRVKALLDGIEQMLVLSPRNPSLECVVLTASNLAFTASDFLTA